MSLKAYIAGPLFTVHERDLLEKIDNMCRELDVTTYLPHRDAGLFDVGNPEESFRFFKHDLEQIKQCDFMIAVLNGADIDAGTSWEMGYAYANSKIILGYLDDIRIFNPRLQLNLMISNSINSLSTSLDQLRAQILKLTRGKR